MSRVVERARNLVTSYDEKGMKGLVYEQADALLRTAATMELIYRHTECDDERARAGHLCVNCEARACLENLGVLSEPK